MKWFQHQTDASDDIKIKRLEDEFGITGYGIFFKIIEKIGKEGEDFALDTKKYPIKLLSRDFRVEEKTMSKCLTFMDKIGLIVLKRGTISSPNMKKYASNWIKRTYRGTTEARQSNDVATTAKEEKKEEENRKEKKDVSSFNKSNPFYKPTGEKMRESAGKKWVIPKNGGDWLEFVGKAEDIGYGK